MRTDLPTGTVTILFTDIEGSTRLLHELGAETYADALAAHRRVIRECCAAEGGVEVDTQGDAFFFAFPTAPGALAAAAAFTESLTEGPIQVRVGLHTGTPLLAEEGYVGGDVHFAARVAATSHGGQVVMSTATAQLVELGLTDLGEHRLKDVDHAVTIFQLGDGSFPPLKTISNTNLPHPASSFVGREDELGEVLTRIEQGARLVTLTGPGGTGKTRLSIEAAAALVPEYKAGVFWVGLATLRDSALVTETIGRVLGAKDGLAEHIGERELLLLLDNLEQVVECAPELGSLLSACPNLTLLVTSREVLRIQGEVEYAVPPLADFEAVSLFCERSQLAPTDEVAELCARLDSLPLAVELAAARTKALTPAQVLERLSQRLDLLKGGRDADPRQQTLRATIEWSYELLSPKEQLLFARLSVFQGGCTLEAAHEVADADVDTLQSLVEKSLVRFSQERYWMLETIRGYATEKLGESGEAGERQSMHSVRYARAAKEIEQPLREYSDEALATVQAELDNLRAGLAYALDRDEIVAASTYMAGLWFYWLAFGSGVEASAWAERYLASPREQARPLDRFHGDLGAAEILRFAGATVRAAQLKRELVATGRANTGVIVDGRVIDRAVAATLSDLAYLDVELGHLDDARSHAEEAFALRRTLGLPHGIGHAQLALAAVEYNMRDFEQARELYADAAAVYEAAGSKGGVFEARLGVAECDVLLGRLAEAEAVLQDVLPRLVAVADQSIEILGWRVAGMLASARDEPARAALLFGVADAKLRDSGLTLYGALEQELLRSYHDRARRDLGDARFQAVYQQGFEERDIRLSEHALASID
jgi:predicted ATPase